MKDCIPWAGPHDGTLKSMRMKEQHRQVSQTDQKPCSPSPCTPRREKIEQLGVKLSLEGLNGGKMFLVNFVSHHPTPFYLAIN